MMAETYIDPMREQFDAFKALPRDTPINMLNLVCFNETAKYPVDHEHAGKNWTGALAYAEYGRSSEPIFQSVGGSIIWRGQMEAMVTGPLGKIWDTAFIAHYPHAGAFLAMITDPDYRNAVVNRQAAVRDSRLIRFAPLDIEGAKFA
jgi:uncharacterized protein (DUF1330 family)